MGLDAVELVMDVEDHFGITMQYPEWERVRTVGDLVAIVHGRISAAHKMSCPTLPAFLKLRSTVRDAIGDHTFRIRPHQRIVQRLSAPQRRKLWERLPDLLGSSPRALRQSRLLRRVLAASSAATLAIAVIAAAVIDVRILPLTIVLAGLCIFLLCRATEPFRTMPPPEWETFGEVAVKIVGAASATKQLQLRSRDDVLKELRPLIASILQVEHDRIVSSARLVEDLGMG